MSGISNQNNTGGSTPISTPNVVIRPYVAGVAVKDAVYQTLSGAVDKASAVSTATTPVLGVIVQLDTPTVGQCYVQIDGDVFGFAGLTPGNVYMLSKTPGQLLWEGDIGNPNYPSSHGNVIQAVAIAMSSSVIAVAIQDQEEL